MKPSTLVFVFLVAFLAAEVKGALLRGTLFELCPVIPCPSGKVCVSAAILRLCRKPVGKGQRCSSEDHKNPDGSYRGAPPCEEGLKCPNNATPMCQ